MSAHRAATAAAGGIHRQIQLPFSKAVEISLKSIKIRFWRSMITAAGIFLGIAFFTSVRMSVLFTDIETGIIQEKQRAIAAGTLKPTVEDTRLIASSASNPEDEEASKHRLQWLSIMALVVCTVGITNAMLMSVTERYKEIGTMKCLGALDMFIVKLFFIESCLLGAIASTVGFLVSWILVSLFHLVSDPVMPFTGRFWAGSGALLVASVAIGSVLTFLATIGPAVKAAQMPTAAALRVEI